jgi:hypothetical protein
LFLGGKSGKKILAQTPTVFLLSVGTPHEEIVTAVTDAKRDGAGSGEIPFERREDPLR